MSISMHNSLFTKCKNKSLLINEHEVHSIVKFQEPSTNHYLVSQLSKKIADEWTHRWADSSTPKPSQPLSFFEIEPFYFLL